MTVTAAATQVSSFTGDSPRPPGHAGWNNPAGDPNWVPDWDWYHRVQLICTGSAGEVGTVVNWECYDDTVPFKTAGDITTATAGAVASPYGAVINHSSTWTIWATTGVATAAAPKYYDTKVAAFSKLRANGPRVQVELGPRKKAGAPTTLWTIAAFLPGAGKLPSATTTITIYPPIGIGAGLYGEFGYQGQLGYQPERSAPSLTASPQTKVIEEEEPVRPENSWNKATISEWLTDHGVEHDSTMTKKELIHLADESLSREGV